MSVPIELDNLCLDCGAVRATETSGPLRADTAMLLMTILDETGRRAVIRTEIPKEIWLDLDPAKAGTIMVTELRQAHAALKRQAVRETQRQVQKEA